MGFIQQLEGLADEKQKALYEGTLNLNPSNIKLGVPMGKVFALAKENISMPNDEIVSLLQSNIHEAKVGAVSIMDFQARSKKTTDAQRKWLHDLYIGEHRHINSWDLVDRAVQHVVGGYLYDYKQPRNILYDLVKSKDESERRSAIVATLYFIRQGDVDDTYAIAALLIDDKEDLIHKAVGGVLREAGKKDIDKLYAFLDTYAKKMASVTRRYATEKLPESDKLRYRNIR